MSSRKGNVILFSELKALLTEKITQEFLEKYRGEWSDQEIEEAGYRLALATIRYGMLSQDNNSQIVFDLNDWTSRTGNTGPYLMYAYARIRSILREAPESTAVTDWSLLRHPTELDLLMHLKQYHETIAKTLEQFSPHVLAAYLYDLCKKFSRMYQECSVLHAESDALRTARIEYLKSIAAVLQHGLSLLGIETVERM